MANPGMETKNTPTGKGGVSKRVILALGTAAIAAAVAAIVVVIVLAWQRQQADLMPPLDGDMVVFDPYPDGRDAPAVSFTDAQGREVTLADYAGQVLVVNFWATWCAPCVAEMPSLNALQQALGDRGVRVMPISIDRGGLAEVEPFYTRLGLDALPIYLDPYGRVPGAFEAIGLPTTVIIGRDGRWLGTLAGDAHWDSPEALALVGFYADRR